VGLGSRSRHIQKLAGAWFTEAYPERCTFVSSSNSPLGYCLLPTPGIYHLLPIIYLVKKENHKKGDPQQIDYERKKKKKEGTNHNKPPTI
jgi:hypothetical protein